MGSIEMRRIIVDSQQSARTFVIPRFRAADRLLARLLSFRLDGELAEGRPPEWSRLHAARADHLESVTFRNELADNWDHVMEVAAGRTATPGRSRSPLRRDRVADAEPRIRELVTLLRGPQPVPARGVAVAHQLLTDGTGPLYQPASKTALSEAVADAIALLNPVALPPMS
jgi:hypothetical protein